MLREWRDAARFVGCALVTLAIVQPAFAVDGVTEINQVRATAGGVTPGDAPGFPVTLDHPGSYRLTGNLRVGTPTAIAIEVTSAHVTIDLNGFEISCGDEISPCGSGSGDGISANQSNVTVVNGTVRDMGNNGITAGANAHIERVRALGNHHYGIVCGNGCALADNIASDNGYDGLGAGLDSTLIGNTARSNGRGGIETNSNCTVSGNTTNGNTVFGIYCNGGCTIERNTANGNATGVSLLGGNSIIGNTMRGNTNFGLVAIGTDSGYALNTLTGNNSGGGGANSPQVSGGTSLGQNLCGTDLVCP